MKRIALFVALFACIAVAASAQTPIPNPRSAEFTPSPDHAAITSYEIGWFLGAAADPVSTVDIGKPTPNASNICTAAINVMPLAFGDTYTAQIRAKAGTIYSEWSLPSNPFSRIPGQPGGPVVKK